MGRRRKPEPEGNRRPKPPPGFVHFYFKTVTVDKMSQKICPYCGSNAGIGWGGPDRWGFTDPMAMSESMRCDRNGYVTQGAGDPHYSVDGVPLLMHWSRYAIGECGCKGIIWHDFGGSERGDWWYYYFENHQLPLFSPDRNSFDSPTVSNKIKLWRKNISIQARKILSNRKSLV